MDKTAIERAARSLQLEIYQSAKNLYPSGLPPMTLVLQQFKSGAVRTRTSQ